jgi:Mrp family chromosome partitioning ATPase/predicted Fe-Mo cluster-binding NifX family protein
MSETPLSAPGGETDPRREVQVRRDANLARIGRVIAVMSGKGGVGKSTVAASLALGLSGLGHRTGLLDVDFHGPTVPILLGLAGRRAASDGRRLQPIGLDGGLRVMSLGLLLAGNDDAVIWRGPMKIGVINQLLGDVEWGDLDFLVLDCPPGTGDEPLSIGQTIPRAEVVMVGTPQEVAMADVRKAVSFCRQLGLRVLGLVETMGTVRCPGCERQVPLFKRRAASRPEGVPVLAEVPFDPALHAACEEGRLEGFLAETSPTADLVRRLAERVAGDAGPAAGPAAVHRDPMRKGDSSTMRYAIPTAGGCLTTHFGHTDQFTLVDAAGDAIQAVRSVQPPPHAPGVLPRWLKEQGVDVVIAGGMGRRAQDLFAEQGIQVVVGAANAKAEDLVRQHLAGTLKTGQNVCDH